LKQLSILLRPIENWDTSEIDNMALLFEGKKTCNPDISKWNVSKVKNFVSTCVINIYPQGITM
jgi:hypothetical protein